MKLNEETAPAPQSTIMLWGIHFQPNHGKSWWENLRFKHCLYILKLIIKPSLLEIILKG